MMCGHVEFGGKRVRLVTVGRVGVWCAFLCLFLLLLSVYVRFLEVVGGF